MSIVANSCMLCLVVLVFMRTTVVALALNIATHDGLPRSLEHSELKHIAVSRIHMLNLSTHYDYHFAHWH
jgi:hypothetical protein